MIGRWFISHDDVTNLKLAQEFFFCIIINHEIQKDPNEKK